MKTMQQLAKEALQVQDAVNPIALTARFGEVVKELRDNLGKENLPNGTDDIRKHAVFGLWVSKLHEMGNMGMSDIDAYSQKSEECERLAG